MRHAFHQLSDYDLDSQFLAQFSRYTLFEGFFWLALSTWKFPQPSQMRIIVPLRDQQFPVAKNQSRRNINH